MYGEGPVSVSGAAAVLELGAELEGGVVVPALGSEA